MTLAEGTGLPGHPRTQSCADQRFELRLSEELGVASPQGKASLALQMAVHQSLPVQREQFA